MKSALRGAVLLAAVAVTACQSGLIYCACPASYVTVVCGTLLARGGTRQNAIRLQLSARNRRVAHAPAHSVIPRPAAWGVQNISMDTITITTHCDRAPVVTVTPAGAARTLAAARAKNGGIAGLTLAQTSNTTIVVRAYRGHRLIGKATIARVTPAGPPPAPSPSPSPTAVPCRRVGHLGVQRPQPLYCLPGPILPNAD